MPQLPPDENLEKFRLEIQTEADLLVEKYTQVAKDIMAKVPSKVKDNLKTFRFDWAVFGDLLVDLGPNDKPNNP